MEGLNQTLLKSAQDQNIVDIAQRTGYLTSNMEFVGLARYEQEQEKQQQQQEQGNT